MPDRILNSTKLQSRLRGWQRDLGRQKWLNLTCRRGSVEAAKYKSKRDELVAYLSILEHRSEEWLAQPWVVWACPHGLWASAVHKRPAACCDFNQTWDCSADGSHQATCHKQERLTVILGLLECSNELVQYRIRREPIWVDIEADRNTRDGWSNFTLVPTCWNQRAKGLQSRVKVNRWEAYLLPCWFQWSQDQTCLSKRDI